MYSELISYMGDTVVQFLSSLYGDTVFSTIYWRHIFFFSSVQSVALKKISSKYIDFSGFFTRIYWYVSVFMPIQCCFGQYRLEVSFKARYYNASSSVLFAQDCFGYSESLWLHTKFTSVFFCFVFSRKNVIGILIGIAFNLWVVFDTVEFLPILIPLVHEHGVFLLFLFLNCSFQFLLSVFCSFCCRGHLKLWLNLFVDIYFFVAFENSFLHFYQHLLLLVYRYTTSFCVLTFIFLSPFEFFISYDGFCPNH